MPINSLFMKNVQSSGLNIKQFVGITESVPRSTRQIQEVSRNIAHIPKRTTHPKRIFQYRYKRETFDGTRSLQPSSKTVRKPKRFACRIRTVFTRCYKPHQSNSYIGALQFYQEIAKQTVPARNFG